MADDGQRGRKASMAKGKNTSKKKKKPRKAKRVTPKSAKAATPKANQDFVTKDAEEIVDAVFPDEKKSAPKKSAGNATKSQPKEPEPELPSAVANTAEDGPRTRAERRADREQSRKEATPAEIMQVEAGDSKGAYLFLGVIFSMLILAVVVALLTK